MSPTLLEFAVVILVIALAWQIGLALAPDVFRLLRSMRRDIDDATDEALMDERAPDEAGNQRGREHHGDR